MKIGHTEKWRAQRFYIVEIVRHRGTNGAWRNRGYLRVLLMFLSTSFQSIGLQDFLKRFLPKLSATRTLRLCRSLYLRHLREVVCFHLRVLPLSVCLLYVVGLIYHSIFRKNLKKAPEVRDTSEAEGECATMICSRLNLSLHISEEPKKSPRSKGYFGG